MQQQINDEDSVCSSKSKCSLNLKDNSTWFIDFNNMNKDNCVLPDYEASSLGESIHSMPSVKDDKNEETPDKLNYKVQRRRRISALKDDTPAETPMRKVKSNSTFSLNTPSEKDSAAPLQK